MNDPKNYPKQSRRASRFEWSAWLAAAFVLLVVAPALQAQPAHSVQTLAPLYAALLPQRNDQAVSSLESALAVLESVPQSRVTNGISAPTLQRADGSHAQQSTVEFDRTPTKPRAIDAPRLFTSHVVLASALPAHTASFLSGTRTNRSHE